MATAKKTPAPAKKVAVKAAAPAAKKAAPAAKKAAPAAKKAAAPAVKPVAAAAALKPIKTAFNKTTLVAHLAEQSGVEPKATKAVLAALEAAILGSVHKKGSGEFTLPHCRRGGPSNGCYGWTMRRSTCSSRAASPRLR